MKREIRILACDKYKDDLAVMLPSVKKYFGKKWKIFVHSDGSMDDKSWVIPLTECTEKLKDVISPELMDLRTHFLQKPYVMVLRMIDMLFLSEADEIFFIDTDCFFCREPTYLIQALEDYPWVHGQGKGWSIGNADKLLEYTDKPAGYKPGGFLQKIPRNAISQEDVCDFLRKMKYDDLKWCNEQGFFHLLLKRKGIKEFGLDPTLYPSTDLTRIDWNKVECIHTTGNHPYKEDIKRAVYISQTIKVPYK